MKRGMIGSYQESVVAGEIVRAFVPEPLPPKESIAFTPQRQHSLEQARVWVPGDAYLKGLALHHGHSLRSIYTSIFFFQSKHNKDKDT